MAHTKGPWKALEAKDGRGNPYAYSVWRDIERPYAESPRGNQICCTPDGTTKENLDNARLISAAPEMLELLEQVAVKHSDKSRGCKLTWAQLEAIKAVIAKAKGETK